MNLNLEYATSDITYIGSGISTSFTLLYLLENIEAARPIEKIDINIIDKSGEFNTGIPYGARSGYSVLLITSLRNFLPEPEYSKFISWLNNNKTWLLDEFRKEGGELSKVWINTHTQQIENNDWGDLFIPRRFFGDYISEKVTNSVKRLENAGLISVNFIVDEVIDIINTKPDFKIFLKNSKSLFSKKVILAVGSLPINYLWNQKKMVEKNNLLFINNPYDPKLKNTLKKIKHFTSNRKGKETNVTIVGANASGLEMLYKLNDLDWEETFISKYTIISTQGVLPDAEIDIKRQQQYSPEYLESLKSKTNLTATEIAEAAFKDLDEADKIKLGAASTVGIISKAFGSLLGSISKDEQEKFACYHGNEIGRRQRCAGQHYRQVIEKLVRQGRFSHLAGRFSGFECIENEYFINYLDTQTAVSTTDTAPAHIVVNCVGSMNLSNKNIPVLYKNVISHGLCIPNDSNIGFKVNDKLESYNNFHIVGPMLAGNVINGMALWHLEHCGRIIQVAGILANKLHQYFSDTSKEIPPLEVDTHTRKLIVRSIKSESSINTYKALLKKYWDNNIYYTYEHLKNFETETDSLKYFLYHKNNEPLIIMTFILRKIVIQGEETIYFDVITPYGYSGPLYGDNVSSDDLALFWDGIDGWYKENNIITEFVRFSLNYNYKNYTGQLVNSLDNVKGKLETSFEAQWNGFIPKVRNNYRKASKHDLECKIFQNNEITVELIKTFQNIYLETMLRNKASKSYFFTWEYFKNLIFNNIENFAIAMVYHKSIPISTELVIINQETIIAFLGGTDSKYFSYRPNDFLRVEVIKWAIDNCKKYYVLGGGVKDRDGLYKHKKSLFPKDKDAVFYTGRKIIDEDIYRDLVKRNGGELANVDLNDHKEAYFPLYRAQGVSNKQDASCELSIITDKSNWKKLLTEVDNYDFYHTYDYHQLSKQTDEEAILIRYQCGDKIIGLPFLKRKIFNSNYYDLTSVYGYAGPIQNNINTVFDSNKFQITLKEWFKQNNIITVFSRLNIYLEGQESILNGLGSIQELSKLVNIDLNLDLDVQRTIFSKTTKRYINKGRRLFTIKKSSNTEAELETFISLYYENMNRVEAKPMYYFKKDYFEGFFKSDEFNTELLFAVDNDTQEIVSGAMMIKTNNIIQYHLSGTRNDFLVNTPLRVLIDETRIIGTKEKLKYFNLGGGLGSKDDSLLRFKASFSKDLKPFKVWKYVVDESIYEEICREYAIDGDHDYFPKYRAGK